MNRNGLISVIVPVYNIKDYIENCIESILKQTYTDLEIILVDDGSTDKSGEICDEYAQKDDRIRVMHKKNGGLSDARNVALDVAKGAYIGFVDGDDWIHPQMYEILKYGMDKYNAGIAACSFSQNEQDLDRVYDNSKIDFRLLSNEELLSNNGAILAVAWNKLYRRGIFDNIRYPVGRVHEDEYVFAEVLYACKSIAFTEQPLYYYTTRDGSIVSELNFKRVEDTLFAFEHRIKFVKSVSWNQMIPVSIIQYCDYCISIHQGIMNGKYQQLDSNVSEKIWKKVCGIVNDNKAVKIGKRYRLFALSPTLYYLWKGLKKE